MNRPGFRNRKPGRFLRTEINSPPQTAQLPGHRGSCLADHDVLFLQIQRVNLQPLRGARLSFFAWTGMLLPVGGQKEAVRLRPDPPEEHNTAGPLPEERACLL